MDTVAHPADLADAIDRQHHAVLDWSIRLDDLHRELDVAQRELARAVRHLECLLASHPNIAASAA